MYRHFLVPVDHTEDSVDLVVRAVNLAASMKARVTFLHTEARAVGQEVLAKAEAAARAWGVPSHAIATGSADTAAAIAAVALDQGCDLILVASHNAQHRAGPLSLEGPIGVLQHSDLPVLVTATANVACSVPAIQALREEHRLLATALHAWSQALEAGDTVHPARMQSILTFIDRLETEHHPKEQGLFLKLRERTSTVDADLDEIGRQHAREGSMLANLADRVHALMSGPDAAVRLDARQALAASVEEYMRFIWDHLGREEAVVLPAARRHLREADWLELQQAFAHADSQALTLESSRLLKDVLERAGDRTLQPLGCPGRGHEGSHGT